MLRDRYVQDPSNLLGSQRSGSRTIQHIVRFFERSDHDQTNREQDCSTYLDVRHGLGSSSGAHSTLLIKASLTLRTERQLVRCSLTILLMLFSPSKNPFDPACHVRRIDITSHDMRAISNSRRDRHHALKLITDAAARMLRCEQREEATASATTKRRGGCKSTGYDLHVCRMHLDLQQYCCGCGEVAARSFGGLLLGYM